MTDNVRVPISRGDRFKVLDRHKFRCYYCGARAGSVIIHIDHVHPVARGGTNDLNNLVPACQDCNLGKGVRPLTEHEMDFTPRVYNTDKEGIFVVHVVGDEIALSLLLPCGILRHVATYPDVASAEFCLAMNEKTGWKDLCEDNPLYTEVEEEDEEEEVPDDE